MEAICQMICVIY